MLNRKKKGFTLAELLIVVAIIVVLVAISVPLFVSGLNKAQEGVFKANARSVKAAAVIDLLSNKSGKDIGDIFKTGNEVYASATVDDNGDITNLKVTYGASTASEISTLKKQVTDSYEDWQGTAEGKAAGVIVVQLTLTDLSEAGITEGK